MFCFFDETLLEIIYAFLLVHDNAVFSGGFLLSGISVWDAAIIERLVWTRIFLRWSIVFLDASQYISADLREDALDEIA